MMVHKMTVLEAVTRVLKRCNNTHITHTHTHTHTHTCHIHTHTHTHTGAHTLCKNALLTPQQKIKHNIHTQHVYIAHISHITHLASHITHHTSHITHITHHTSSLITHLNRFHSWFLLNFLLLFCFT